MLPNVFACFCYIKSSWRFPSRSLSAAFFASMPPQSWHRHRRPFHGYGCAPSCSRWKVLKFKDVQSCSNVPAVVETAQPAGIQKATTHETLRGIKINQRSPDVRCRLFYSHFFLAFFCHGSVCHGRRSRSLKQLKWTLIGLDADVAGLASSANVLALTLAKDM